MENIKIIVDYCLQNRENIGKINTSELYVICQGGSSYNLTNFSFLKGSPVDIISHLIEKNLFFPPKISYSLNSNLVPSSYKHFGSISLANNFSREFSQDNTLKFVGSIISDGEQVKILPQEIHQKENIKHLKQKEYFYEVAKNLKYGALEKILNKLF